MYVYIGKSESEYILPNINNKRNTSSAGIATTTTGGGGGGGGGLSQSTPTTPDKKYIHNDITNWE